MVLYWGGRARAVVRVGACHREVVHVEGTTVRRGAGPGRIFISYRREESAYPAGWLYDRLAERYGEDQIFKDVDSIELGDDFVEEITRAVAGCDVLLALVGEHWLTATDPQGRRRLDDPQDFVRLEIEAALSRGVRVVPILVDGAHLPGPEQLPSTLAPLVRRQALELSPARFDSDTSRLLKVLDRTLAEVASAGGGDVPRATSPRPAGHSIRWAPVGAAATVVAVILLVVLFATRSGEQPSADGNPTAGTGTGVASQAGTGASAASAGAESRVVFRDDFSDPSAGWAVHAATGSVARGRYADGGYRIVLEPQPRGDGVAALPSRTGSASIPSDVVVTVDARRLPASVPGMDLGLLCRVNLDTGTGYYFGVSDGYLSIVKLGPGDAYVPLSHRDDAPVDAGAVNHLKASCVQDGDQGVRLALTVNDLRPLPARDAGTGPFRGGTAGLFVGTNPRVHKAAVATFDDFVVARNGGSG
jgi:hypothetical protein